VGLFGLEKSDDIHVFTVIIVHKYCMKALL